MTCIVHPRLVAQARVDTPLGPMLLAATEAGLAGAWFDGQKHHPGALAVPVDARQRHLQAAAAALQVYWRGEPGAETAIAALKLDLAGTPFQRRVWQALGTLAPGHTRTYTELAATAGLGHAVRAVAAAVGRNPVSVLLPCHRVLGHDGRLTGYAGGLPRKRALLDHEARLREASATASNDGLGSATAAHQSRARKSSIARLRRPAAATAGPHNRPQ